MRRRIAALAAAAALLALAMILPRACRAASFLLRVAAVEPPRALRLFDAPAVDESAASVPAGDATLRARIFRPRGRAPRSTLVAIHGLHPHGIDDARFTAFAHAAAYAGFIVVAPDFPEMRAFRVEAITVERVDHALRWAAERPDLGDHLGALGISYGAGPMFIAAARPGLVDRVRFLVSVGGYYDLADTLRYGLTGEFIEDGRPASLPPHPWARLIFTLNFVDALAPPGDRDALAAAIRKKLDLDDAASDAAAKRLGPEGAALFAALNGPASHDLGRLVDRVGPALGAAVGPLSPEDALRRTRARVYLLHGDGDDVVPRSETGRLADALAAAGRPPAARLVTTVFSHVTTQGASLTDNLAMWRFGYALVGEAR